MRLKLVVAGACAYFACLLLLVAANCNIKEVGNMNTVVKVTPSKTTLIPGEKFTVEVSIEPGSDVNVAGAQFDLSYNTDAVQIDSVVAGTLFGTMEKFFLQGTLDQITGNLKGVVLVVLGAGQSVNTPGSIAVLNCTAVAAGKTSMFALSNVIVGDKDAVSLPLESPVITQMQVASPWDLDLDGSIDLKDLMLVVAAFGTAGEPGWAREDVNVDGQVNVLDMISEAQHFS
jgi:hypothetical protein